MAVNQTQKFEVRPFDEQGFSSIEALILMVCFTLMVSFTLGVFGIIHSGILQSIGSRNYAFETFRHRANLTYIRDADPLGSKSGIPATLDSYVGVIVPSAPKTFGENFRLHFVESEVANLDGSPQATERPLAKGRDVAATNENVSFHEKVDNEANLAAGMRYNNQDGVNPAWIKVVYGICMNAECQ